MGGRARCPPEPGRPARRVQSRNGSRDVEVTSSSSRSGATPGQRTCRSGAPRSAGASSPSSAFPWKASGAAASPGCGAAFGPAAPAWREPPERRLGVAGTAGGADGGARRSSTSNETTRRRGGGTGRFRGTARSARDGAPHSRRAPRCCREGGECDSPARAVTIRRALEYGISVPGQVPQECGCPPISPLTECANRRDPAPFGDVATPAAWPGPSITGARCHARLPVRLGAL